MSYTLKITPFTKFRVCRLGETQQYKLQSNTHGLIIVYT